MALRPDDIINGGPHTREQSSIIEAVIDNLLSTRYQTRGDAVFISFTALPFGGMALTIALQRFREAGWDITRGHDRGDDYLKFSASAARPALPL